MKKVCRKCNIEKDIFLFPKRSIDVYRNCCKECMSIYKRERYNIDKQDPEFVKKVNYQGRMYKKENREKVLSDRKTYYINNKDTSKIKDRIYYEKNKGKKMERRRQYRVENRERLNRQNRELLKNNPLLRLKCNLRTLIGNSLREKGYSKKSKTEQILGCSFIEFKQYIELLFLPNMNWENRDDWHIDHVVPLDFAINENEILKLNHYTNLRPLWIKDNLEKSNSITDTTDIYYQILKERIIV